MLIAIDVTSDFICPWCRIAEKHLTIAIAQLPKGVDVAVRWLPFELNPAMPVEGLDRKTYRTLKFGSWRRSQELDADTVVAGAADGVVFNYDRMNRTPNTFAAHRLAWLAANEDRQHLVVDGLFRGYFAQGRDIGDLDVLASIAHDAGIEHARARDFLLSHAGADEVRQLEALAHAQGVSGVPHFNIAGSVMTGAQSPNVLRRALLDDYQRASDRI